MSQQETRQERRARERKERKHSQRESEFAPTEAEATKGGKGAYLLSALVGAIIALILVKAVSHFRGAKDAPLEGSSGQRLDYGDVLELSPEQVSEYDIATLNLICGSGLNGTEEVNIEACLKRLDEMVAKVKSETNRSWNRWQSNPAQYQNSLAHYKMGMLITVVREDFKTTYNPDLIMSPQAATVVDGFFNDANDIFLQGLLTEKKMGTCASMPVLYVAIARKLGYPVFLVSTKGHLFCRWDDGNERMNFEGTGNGISINPDEYYHSFPFKLTAYEVDNTSYLKNRTRAQELASFLDARARCLVASNRKPEAFVAMAQAMRLAEKDGLAGLSESLVYGGILPEEIPQMIGRSHNPLIPNNPQHFDVQRFNEMNRRRMQSTLPHVPQIPQYPHIPQTGYPVPPNSGF